MKVNLNKYLAEGVKVFAGRDKGGVIRKILNLDFSDNNKEKVTIVIEDHTYSITHGFFCALFGDSVRKLGKEEFNRRYNFICDEYISYTIVSYVNKLTVNEKCK